MAFGQSETNGSYKHHAPVDPGEIFERQPKAIYVLPIFLKLHLIP